jgi:hypothetical protein
MAILLAVLLFDILLTVFLGATAIPVNIIMGTLLTILFTLSLVVLYARWREWQMKSIESSSPFGNQFNSIT